MRYLNESSALNVLRQRYGSSLTHTYAGPTMVSINPMAPLQIYTDKVIKMFGECKVEEMPPHVFAIAAAAHRNMLQQAKDQSVVFIGRSGCGKTTNVRHVLNYYASMGASNSKHTQEKSLTSEKLTAVFNLLEAFGNARTVMNANATRFASLFSVDFDSAGLVASASVQTMLLEKARVVRRPEGEPNFNVFYQMLAGLDSKTRRDLQLEGNLADPNLFMTPLTRAEDKYRASQAWANICAAFKTIGATAGEAGAVSSALAAIFHLGAASVSRAALGSANAGRPQFARPQAAQRAAQCLGTTLEELTRSVFQGQSTSSSNINRKLRSSDAADGIESLEGFVTGLYQETFNAVVFLINR